MRFSWFEDVGSPGPLSRGRVDWGSEKEATGPQISGLILPPFFSSSNNKNSTPPHALRFVTFSLPLPRAGGRQPWGDTCLNAGFFFALSSPPPPRFKAQHNASFPPSSNRRDGAAATGGGNSTRLLLLLKKAALVLDVSRCACCVSTRVLGPRDVRVAGRDQQQLKKKKIKNRKCPQKKKRPKPSARSTRRSRDVKGGVTVSEVRTRGQPPKRKNNYFCFEIFLWKMKKKKTITSNIKEFTWNWLLFVR